MKQIIKIENNVVNNDPMQLVGGKLLGYLQLVSISIGNNNDSR